MQPELRKVQAGGLELAVWDWPGPDPPLLWAHATGFHGRCWDGLVRLFPGRRSIVPEFRGHGRSARPDPPYPWRRFGEDLVGVARALGIRGAIGIGHSMGAHSLVSAAALQPDLFAALLLLDPVLYPPDRYGEPVPDLAFIERRRIQWDSPAAMFERYYGRGPFATWQTEALHDYCDYALVPDGNGGLELACPPTIEAAIYREAKTAGSNLYGDIPSIVVPVTVMRGAKPQIPGQFDLAASPTWSALAAQFPRGRDRQTEFSHYIPMEAPHLVAEEIALLDGVSKRPA